MKNSTFLLLLLFPTILFSQIQWQENGIPVRIADDIEWNRSGVSIGSDLVYVWTDCRRGDRDIWAQRVDIDGNNIWEEDVLICGEVDNQTLPILTKTANNNIIIAWIDFRIPFDENIYAQKIDENGNVLWNEVGIPICVYEEKQDSVQVVTDDCEGAYFFWRDRRNQGGSDIYGIHLQSTGEIAAGWEINGNPIAIGIGSQYYHSTCKDGNGGVIITWQESGPGYVDIYAQRINANGDLLWLDGILITNVIGAQEKPKIIPDNSGNFYVTWRDRRNEYDGDIYAQKIDVNGNILWENDIEVCLADDVQRNQKISLLTDNSVIVAWEDKRNTQYYTDIYAQKIDTNGNLLWNLNGVPICTAYEFQYYLDLVPDNFGGSWITWSDCRNNGYPNMDIYLQHVDANGEILLDENGNLICNADRMQEKSIIKKNVADEVFILWNDWRTGSSEIYLQTLDEEGNFFLPENGETIISGISGCAVNHRIIANGDNPIIVWQDYRDVDDGVQIYLQILNSDGSSIFEEDGIPITQNTGYSQENFDCTHEQDSDCIAVVWEEIRGDFKQIYAQGIDLNGNFLWSQDGIPVAEIEGSQDLPHISVKNNNGVYEYYIGWMDFRDHFNPDIYGQKIIDGEIQWSEQGVQISNREGQDEFCEIIENFYIWQGWVGTSHINIYAQMVDENGNPAPGWSEQGLEVCFALGNQHFPKCLLIPEGLLIIWEDRRAGDDDIYGQIVTEEGNILWQEDGTPLVSCDHDQVNPVFVYDNGIIYIAWQDFRSSDSYDIYVQKFDLNGNAVWESELAIATGKNAQVNPELVKVEDRFVLFWTEYYWAIGNVLWQDIKSQLISEEGEILWADNGITICDARYDQKKPLAVSNGENDVYCIWEDERAFVYPGDEINIYAQKLHIDDSEIEENEISEQSGMFLENFPNPFSSSTTISFKFSNEQNQQNEQIKLEIYNLKGQKVKSFNVIPSGVEESIVWDGTDNSGNPVSSGIYFYKLVSGKESITKKMLLLR